MRPLLIPSSYPPHFGGVEEVASRLAGGLRDLGHAPLVLTHRWPKTLPRDEVIDGIPVERISFRTPHRSARGITGYLLLSAAARREAVARARAHGAEVVNPHCISSNAAYSEAISTALGIPLVVSVHGEISADATGIYQRDAGLVRRWRRLIDAAAVVTAPSAHSLAEAEQLYGADLGDRAAVIRNGVDVELFSGPRNEGEPAVLAVGRLVHTKGFDVLIDAWSALPLEGRPRLVIAGDGPEMSSLRTQAAGAPGGDRVEFVGRQSREQIAALHKRASVFVQPSRVEPLGLTALEAMAAGTPVIASRVGGLPEIVVDGVTGRLVGAGDAAQLADAIREVFDDPAGVGRRSAAAFDIVSSNTWDACVAAFVECYSSATRAG